MKYYKNLTYATFLTAILLTGAASCSAPTPQSSVQSFRPQNLKQATSSQDNLEERTNERLKDTSPQAQAVMQAEKNFISYLGGNTQIKKQLSAQILQDIQTIENAVPNCPGHLPYVARFLYQQITHKSLPKYTDPWQQAAYDYIISRPDLAKELRVCSDYRLGKSRTFSAVNHIEVGMFSRHRAELLEWLIEAAGWQDRLKGKTVADIGGGAGLLLAQISERVTPTGKLICVDIEPELKKFCNYLAKRDPKFQRIEYRLVNPHSRQTGLAKGEADLICLFDIHNIYDKFSSDNETERYRKGAAYLNNLTSSLKENGELLVYDSAELMAPREVIEKIALLANLSVQNIEISEPNQHYLLRIKKAG
ncbi:MAG: class I SAM-dependent methyltransferase [Candidatus Bruticola sp.]